MLTVVKENRQFRKLWASQVVSQLGDWLGRLAVLSLIYELGETAAAVGVGALYGTELALRFLPSAALSPLAGSIADRVPRRALMVFADVGRGLVVLAMLLVRTQQDLVWLYGLLVAQMALSVFFETARSAALPSTVPPERLQDAHALSAVTWSVLLSIGALVGGALVASIGIAGTFILDAASYLVSAAILIGLRLPRVPKQSEPFRVGDALLFREMRRGWKHAREIGVTPAVLTKGFWGAAGGFLVLLPIAATTRFVGEAQNSAVDAGQVAAHGALLTGFLFAARGLGTGLGPVVARYVFGRNESALRLQISIGFLVGAFGYALFIVAPNFQTALLCVAFAHGGGSVIWVSSSVLWQRRVYDRFRGRVQSVEFIVMFVAFACGGLIGGLSYDFTQSLPWAMALLSALVFGGGIAWTGLARRSPGAEAPAM